MAINRQQLFDKCLRKVNAQIEKHNEKLASIKESMDSMDRHNDYDEEGKMLGEYEKFSSHLDNSQKMKQTLRTIDWDKYTETVQLGSVIETEKNYYLIATALGEISMDDGSKVFAVSTEAPIFKELEGKRAGDTFTLQGNQVEILDVH